MDEVNDVPTVDYTQLTADLVSAYVSRNAVRAADLPALIAEVHTAFTGLSSPAAAPEEKVEKATATQIRKSVTPDALISFIDGKPYKTLRRHLSTQGFTFETYRARYGLPADYPTTAANYSATRSALAKQVGLGQQRKAGPEAAKPKGTTLEVPPAKMPRKGGRKKTFEPAAAE